MTRAPRLRGTLAERFWRSLDRSGGPDACWPWLLRLDRDGYGHLGAVKSDGRRTMRKAHHVSLELHTGNPFPDGAVTLHSCDNARCVNPAHLSIGTTKQNNDDMIAKGRNVFQKRNPSKKLTDEQVRSIRARRREGALLRVIASEFNVCEGTISSIASFHQRKGAGQ